MTIQASPIGIAAGQFSVPADIPAGTKSVVFNGADGSRAEALYTGSSKIETAKLGRLITTARGFEPLAQTFTLEAARQIAAVEVYFTQLGSSPIRVQIREMTTGLPNQEILAQSSLDANQLTLDGASQFAFTPVHLNADQEYAIVLLTDDVDYEVAVAEVGQLDQNQGWVTSQPYQVGVLLSSSNGQTWTAHQNTDLAFNLLAAKFSQTSVQVPLGTAMVADVSDLLLLAGIERPTVGSDVQIVATTTSGTKYRLQEDRPLNLPTRLIDDVLTDPETILPGLSLLGEIRGSEQFSPVIYPGIQLAKGKLDETAEYISRAFASGDNATIKVTFDAIVPGQANVAVFADIDDEWQALTLDNSSPVEGGWLELAFSLADTSTELVRIKLVLSGNAQDRPRVRRLRAISI